MTIDAEEVRLLSRREAIRRVSLMLGGVAFVGGTNLLTACEKAGAPSADTTAAVATKFTPEDIAYLDEIAETILPATQTPGAKAAKTGAFMALMVTDSYGAADQRIFRDGMRKVDDATKKANNVGFMAATPAQRLAVLTALDKEQKSYMDALDAADRKKKGLAAAPVDAAPNASDAHLPDERKDGSTGGESNAAAAITGDAPAHYFRMMKELALLGYFTSEIGYTKAMRYVEAPGRFDPCLPYTAGEPAWAPHA
ncbi:MAG: gluconate 2-dehydrogenase subunit 3 family protein [bacterium]